MKLKERLTELKDGYVYLGQTEMSSFFAIGKASDLLDRMDEIDEDNRKALVWKIGCADRSICQLRRTMEKRILEDEDFHESDRKKAEKAIETAEKNRQKLMDVRDTWVPIEEREIVSEYERITEHPGAAILILEGWANGKWWTEEEYTRGYIDTGLTREEVG